MLRNDSGNAASCAPARADRCVPRRVDGRRRDRRGPSPRRRRRPRRQEDVDHRALAAVASSPFYDVRGNMNGIVLLRPAQVVLSGRGQAVQFWWDEMTAGIAKATNTILRALNSSMLQFADIEWITANIGLDSTPLVMKKEDQGEERVAVKKQGDDGKPMHRLMFGMPTIRTVAPFDWAAYLRQGGLELEKPPCAGNHEFFKLKGPLAKFRTYLAADTCPTTARSSSIPKSRSCADSSGRHRASELSARERLERVQLVG